jgi:chromobox protein 5
VESTPEPVQATKKRGRDRQKAKSNSGDEDAEEEDTRSKKRGRRSNGVNRKASPSPASSSDRGSPAVELLEPSAIKKWKNLPSWERHVETIDTVEKTEDGVLLIYFRL